MASSSLTEKWKHIITQYHSIDLSHLIVIVIFIKKCLTSLNMTVTETCYCLVFFNWFNYSFVTDGGGRPPIRTPSLQCSSQRRFKMRASVQCSFTVKTKVQKDSYDVSYHWWSPSPRDGLRAKVYDSWRNSLASCHEVWLGSTPQPRSVVGLYANPITQIKLEIL